MSIVPNVVLRPIFLLVLVAINVEGSNVPRRSASRRHAAEDVEDVGRAKSRRSPGGHFGYGNTDEWGRDNPSCWGTRQSPVDLSSYDMARLDVPSPFRWQGYDKIPKKMTLQNNGHSVLLTATWDDEDNPRISGGVLDSDYAFYQLHFHWGPSDDVGSEHTVNNHSLPLEMHMVHYKKQYGSMGEAKSREDGLAVVGVFFVISKNRSDGISELNNYASSIKVPDSRVDIKPFPLSDFDINFPGEYAAYLGSLTTPPCSEIVTWILPATPRFVTRKQMKFFRSVQMADGGDRNYRPTMPRNGRMIYYISY